MAKYNTITITFPVNNGNEMDLYYWLKRKRCTGAFIKDILEKEMNKDEKEADNNTNIDVDDIDL